MLETICTNCKQRYQLGQDHTCPKKSTAAKAGRTNHPSRVAQLVERRATEAVVAESPVVVGSIPAPPVDTPKRGRPKTITDMRAYKALKAVEYRARKKQSDKP